MTVNKGWYILAGHAALKAHEPLEIICPDSRAKKTHGLMKRKPSITAPDRLMSRKEFASITGMSVKTATEVVKPISNQKVNKPVVVDLRKNNKR